MNHHHVGSSVLLVGGGVLVFGGLSAALGFSMPGIVASVAAIVALLYAGGVWFGGAPHVDPSVVLFTRSLTVAAGPLAGRRVADLFPDAMRRTIEAQCREAVEGRASQFSCGKGAGEQAFEASPVRGADGLVAYGLLLSGSLVAEAAEQFIVAASG
jgi:hypothetical protein